MTTRRETLAAFVAATRLSEWSAPTAEAPDLKTLKSRMPRTAKIIEESAAKGGAGQFYVSLHDKPIADVAWGKNDEGAAIVPETIVSWASAVKPSTCICLAKLWDRGKLDLDDRVTKFIPEFGVNGKEKVRIRHLLTHTAHLGGYGASYNRSPSFEVSTNKIIQSPRVPYPEQKTLPPLGLGPGYNPAGIWILAEICRRVYGHEFQDIIRQELFEPAGMLNSWCGMTAERYRAFKSQGLIAVIGSFGRPGREKIPPNDPGNVSTTLANEAGATICQPAGGGAGPTRELARVYEIMLHRGSWRGHRILLPQTVEAMTTPKTGLCYMAMWGLGFNCAIPENVPIPTGVSGDRLHRYGRHASTRTFGHAGASSMQAWGDPENGVATAFIGGVAIFDSIYEDLELAKG